MRIGMLCAVKSVGELVTSIHRVFTKNDTKFKKKAIIYKRKNSET